MAQSVGAIALDIVMGNNTVSGVARQAMADVQRVFNDGTATIGNKVSAIGSACTAVGASLAPVSAAAMGVIQSTASAAMSFETAMAQVKTIAGDASVSYKGNMTDMSNAILQLSTDSGIAAQDIANATYGAISAGVETSKSVEFVSTANALAVGGFSDITTAVDVLTTTLNAYGDKAGTAESISDKLITTQNLGKTTVNELASSMGKVIPTASAYGISVDNLCASYVAMTKGGIATSEATTYMKSMFNELGNSGSTVGKILKDETGKSFGELMKEGKSLGDIIDILGKSVNGDSEAFAQLWGSSEAGTGALAILNGGTADFNNTLKEMGNSTGATSTAMDQMNDTSAHKMQTAMNKMKNAAIEFGGAFTPVIETVASIVGNLATAFSNLPGPVQTAIAVVMGVIAVAAPIIMAIGGIISAVGSVISAVGIIQGAVMAFTGFISATVIPALSSFFAFLLANPIVLVITAIIAVVALLIANWDTVKEVTANVWNAITTTVSSAVESVKSFLSGVIDFVANNWQNLLLFIVNPFAGAFALLYDNCEGFRNFVDGFLENVKTIISNVLNVIKDTISNVLTAISTTVSNIWNAILTTISNILTGISNTVSNIWNAIETAISNVVNAIKTTISNVWDAIKTVISNALNAIKTTVSNIWNNISTTVSNVLNSIKTTVSNIWNNIKTAISNTLNSIKTTISNIWNNIKTAISNALNSIKTNISNIWSTIKTTVSNVLNAIKTSITTAFNNIVNGVKNSMTNVLNAVKNGFTNVKSHITGLASQATTWGKDMIMGIVNGIRSCIGAVGDAAKSVADKIKSFLHFSRPDEGPLREYEVWMPDFMEGLANGINANKHRVVNSVKDLAGQMSINTNATLSADAPALKNVGGNANVNAGTDTNDKLYSLLTQLVNNMQNIGDITVPVYLGNDLIDEQILSANDRRTVRSGGRA